MPGSTGNRLGKRHAHRNFGARQHAAADYVLCGLADRRARHPDQHAGDSNELAHIIGNSDAQILIGCAASSRTTTAPARSWLPGLDASTAEALRIPTAPYLRSICSTTLSVCSGRAQPRICWSGPTRSTHLILRYWPPSSMRSCLRRRFRRLHVGQHRSTESSGPRSVGGRSPTSGSRALLRRPEQRPHSVLAAAFWMGGISAALQC